MIMEVLKLTTANFEETILKADKTAIVDFYADWCGPCKMQSPIIDKIAKEHDELVVGKLNVDDNGEIAVKYGVMSIPTLLIIKNGEIKKQFVGLTDESDILKEI